MVAKPGRWDVKGQAVLITGETGGHPDQANARPVTRSR
jgi:hypothetical protein